MCSFSDFINAVQISEYSVKKNENFKENPWKKKKLLNNLRMKIIIF